LDALFQGLPQLEIFFVTIQLLLRLLACVCIPLADLPPLLLYLLLLLGIDVGSVERGKFEGLLHTLDNICDLKCFSSLGFLLGCAIIDVAEFGTTFA
jgi:hypothetical protein